MSDFNSANNRAVWFDIPVVDLDRATKFYSEVLAIKVSGEDFDGFKFAILEHDQGNGGCLVPKENEVTADKGILLYLNTNGRIQDAVAKVEACGGKVTEPVHTIGQHGFRALVIDSEGNRLALHSESDQ